MIASAITALRTWPLKRLLFAAVFALTVAAVTGVPTRLIPTKLYRRMTSVTWWDYGIWVVSALLAGLVIATYLPRLRGSSRTRLGGGGGRTLSAGIMSFFAIGCPVCNKLVVLILGVSGALDIYAPAQPAIGLLGIALLAAGLVRRLGTPECAIE